MNTVSFEILDWSAWSPDAQTKLHWVERQWQQSSQKKESQQSTQSSSEVVAPNLEQVAAMLRRRFSRLTKMGFHVASECAQGKNLRTVFSSPHGEIHKTRKLLDQIAVGEVVSPMAFSLSVHNTSSGMYSIATGNQSATTALASGASSLEYAVIDAVARLQGDDQSPVLVVYADEPLPEFYRYFGETTATPYALALLVGVVGDVATRENDAVLIDLTFTASRDNSDPFLAASSDENASHGLRFLQFICDTDSHMLETNDDRLRWTWQKLQKFRR